MTETSTLKLGEFLRACRGRVRPETVGLPAGRGRRVQGLRREEVAALSGVSVDYYVRLEQGRERHPSVQVVNGLANLFRLDRNGRMHLAQLADLMPAIDFGAPTEQTTGELAALVEAWPHTPAVVFNEAYDPLTENHLGRALFSVFGGKNLALSVFLDPGAREFYLDWPSVAQDTAGALRHSLGRWPDSARLAEVVRVLHANSAEFSKLWADVQVIGKTRTEKLVQHPDVGRLELIMQSFEVLAAPGHEMVVYQTPPGSASSDRLSILGSISMRRA